MPVKATGHNTDGEILVAVDDSRQTNKFYRSCLANAGAISRRSADVTAPVVASGFSINRALDKICSKISSAWTRPLSDVVSPSTQSLIIDNIGPDKLPVKNLAKLLSSKKLLPANVTGGLVISNVELDGPLILDHATVKIPLNLNKVVIPSGIQVRTDQGRPEREFSISMSGTKFEKRFTLSNSDIKGRVLILSAVFESGVHFFNNHFGMGKFGQSIFIRDTKIDPIFLIVKDSDNNANTSIDGSFIFTVSTTGFLNVARQQFKAPVEFSGNKVDRLYIRNSEFHGGVTVSLNQIDEWLDLSGISYISGSTAHILNNQIGGLDFEASFGSAGTNETELINLNSNTIGNDGAIKIAAEWEGEIDISNTTALSILQTYRTFEDIDWRRRVLPTGIEGCNSENADPLVDKNGNEIGDRKLRNAAQKYLCKEAHKKMKKVVYNLGASNIHRLWWNQPVNGENIWKGNGLRYADWQFNAGNNAGSSTDDLSVRKLFDWRMWMSSPNPDALLYLADYLETRGQLGLARDARREGKQLNYPCGGEQNINWGTCTFLKLPVVTAKFLICPLSQYFFTFCQASKGSPKSPTTNGQTDGASPNGKYTNGELKKQSAEYVISNFKSSWLFVLLAPGGYGANPEWALGWLVVFWAVFWGIYASYRHDWKWSSPMPSNVSAVNGFCQFDTSSNPVNFRLWQYSLDVMLPLISLHAYDRYYPDALYMRALVIIQHVLGWWLVTVFLASLTLL